MRSPPTSAEDSGRVLEKPEDVESLLSRLNVEKRIQFGAEKFLEALESQTSSIPQEARPALRSKVNAELSASRTKIRNLEQAIIRTGGPDRSGGLVNEAGDPSNVESEPDNSLTHALSPAFKTLRHENSKSTMASGTSSLSRRTSERSRGGSRTLSRPAKGTQIEGGETGKVPEFPQSHLSLTKDDVLDHLCRDESQWSLVSTSYGGGSQSGFSEPQAENGREVAYEEQMDPSVTIELVRKAQQSLEQLVRIRQTETSDSKSLKEVGPHIANLTKFARLSPLVIANIDFVKLVDATFCYALEPNPSPIKAACYRLYRNFMLDRNAWLCLEARGMEWLLIRTFAKASRQIPEMEQAILLIRAIISLPKQMSSPLEVTHGHSLISATRKHSKTSAISQGLVRILISMAENLEDPFQAITLETLTELALIDLDALLLADGWRFILQIYEHGPYKLTQALTPALLSLLDKPGTRNMLTPDTGLGVIFSGFTNAYGSGSTHLERLSSTSINVLEVLRSWSGLTLCCMHDRGYIKALVDALRVPVIDTREALVDTFFELFQFHLPPWYHGIFDGKIGSEDEEPRRHRKSSLRSKVHLADQYKGLLLAVFIEAGVLEALVDIVEEQAQTLSKKSIQLISDILASAAKLLPLKYATHVQTLPRLFECAASLNDPHARVPALDALSTITNSTRHQTRVLVASSAPIRKRSNSQTDPVERGQRQMDQARRRLGMQMDDRQFQSALVDSQVLYTKDHTKWNYDILIDIIEGPLLTARRLEEAFRVSKFGRRLMTFFQPLYRRFSDIKKSRLNRKWVKLGTTLMSSLLATSDGVMILAEDQLLRQIVDCFMELDQYAGHPNPQPYFSRNRMENTLSCGYFDMIHVLSKNTEGIKLLERFNFFTCFYHLSELRSRDDLSRAIIGHLDYSSDGHARIILSKALTSSYMHTRLYATQRLGRLLEEENAATWTLELLVTQLYDPAFEVCEAAAHYLEAACEERHVLEAVVNLQPTLDHLGDVGQCLLMRFLSTAAGFSYLRRANYIDREIDEWFRYRNMEYVSQIELHIGNHLRGSLGDSKDIGQQFPDVVPPNFYGEIAKTTEGCHILAEKGHVACFARIAREHSVDNEDESKILRMKSVLWALGNIGSSEGGLPFLEQEDILEHIIDLAEHAAVLSIRGTCFFVLGLVASTTEGCDILEEYGWIPTVSSRGNLTGLCLPDDISDFLNLDFQPAAISSPSVSPVQQRSGHEAKLLQDVSNLGNYVLATQAMQSLARLRNRHRQLFGSVSLYMCVMRMLCNEHYKQPVRAFVLDMFDLQLNAATVAAMSNFARSEEASDPSLQPDTSSLPNKGNDDPTRQVYADSHGINAETRNDTEQPRTIALPRVRIEGFKKTQL